MSNKLKKGQKFNMLTVIKPFTRKEILDMTPPNDIPLPPFCYAKQVSIDAVLDEMNVPK